MSGALVITLADRHVTRDERRRANTLASIANVLNALRMLAEHSIPMMGNAASAEALLELARRLDYEKTRATTLAEEFRELGQIEPEESCE